ncbi:carboxymuconolactone decarboxylase family protein [Natrarchaeobius oligotrophus]|uniref:Carboxymuconolactone decarboxylase family protein n=1 Tax=Natrarchaeobius chitinivorans TaxID=1679083 RepID=A0A3N6MT02_NATCH|nr:carboxymuconolactone decarboxylase family protein [Natrarchaeobius chitinivorans]RQG99471.1 carboxymuconolactone decarboxylase family protein [Natrarchaeobius chitinivorans]
MPEIDPVTDASVRSDLEDVLEECEERGTPGTKAIKILAHRPDVARTFVDNWNASFYEGTIDHTLKELVRAHLANLHGCEYCSSVGSNVAREQGLTDEKVRALAQFESCDLFTEEERVAIRFAEAFYNNQHQYDELHEHFDDGEIIELVWFVSLQDAGEKFVTSMDLRPGSCEIPDDHPLADAE